MPEPSSSDDLLAAISDAFRGDRTKLRAMVQQRAQERVRSELRSRPDAVARGAQARDRIPPARTVAVPQPIPRPEPDWPVEIRLRNGRRIRAVLAPAVARRRDLDAIGRVSAANDRRASAAIQRQSDALEALKRSHEELTETVAALQGQADLAVIGLLEGFAGLERRVQDVQTQGRAVVADTRSAGARAARQRRELRALAVTSRIQNVNNVVSSAQSAAYGQRGSILATNNLLLAGNQLLWSFIDPLLRSLGLDPLLRRLGLSDGTSPSLLAYLAPLGSLVTGHVALGNRQHVRFISGVATFDSGTRVVLDSLRDRIADALWPEFQRRTDVPVTAIALDRVDRVAIAADVRQGVLRIAISRIDGVVVVFPRVRVAWMVDTGADVG